MDLGLGLAASGGQHDRPESECACKRETLQRAFAVALTTAGSLTASIHVFSAD